MDAAAKRTVVALALTALMLAGASAARGAPVRDSILVGDLKTPRLMDPDTGKISKRPPFKGPEDMNVLRSADGRSLIGTYSRPEGSWVLRYSLVSGATERIGPFPVPGSYHAGIAVSPDGASVAVTTRTVGEVTLPNGMTCGSDGPVRMDLLRFSDVSATALIAPIPAIVRQECGDHNPEFFSTLNWSPDGTQLAYVHRHEWRLTGAPPGDQKFAHLVVVAADGSSSRIVAEDLALVTSEIAWSPNGRKLATQTTSGLQLIDVVTGARKKIASGRSHAQTFSASGRHLAYIANPSLTKSVLHISNLATGKDIKPKLSGAAYPSWARRGERLVVCSDRRLRLVTAAGKVKPLTSSTKWCPGTWGPTPNP
jgi:hypothetical protein